MVYKSSCKDDIQSRALLYCASKLFTLAAEFVHERTHSLRLKEIIGGSAPILKPPWLLLKNPLPGVDARNVWIAPRGSRK